jgi:putative oxygen-independent coproporphyrinogen III oxidase
MISGMRGSAVGLESRPVTGAGFGVYVHIPFCRHRCHYCDFNTYEGREDLHDAYVDALVTHIETYPGTGFPRATSVFFGGGTPTLLPPDRLARVLQAVADRVGLAPGAEVTVEVNPETVDEPSFEALLGAGFTRVSVGVQSLVPHVLAGLGRTHSPDCALEALRAARRAGFEEVNGDLIYGSPWESGADWVRSLNGLVDEGPDHISAYALTIEEGTPLATLVASGRVNGIDPDVQAERHGLAQEILGDAGYVRYEISNWARPGHVCRHNVLYWTAGDYLGFGAGAHGHLSGRRYWSIRLPREFIAAVQSGAPVEAGSETLAGDRRAGEALMLGLRLTSGIDVEEFRARFGPGFLFARAGEIRRLTARGLLESAGGKVRVSEGAVLVADDVVARLL